MYPSSTPGMNPVCTSMLRYRSGNRSTLFLHQHLQINLVAKLVRLAYLHDDQHSEFAFSSRARTLPPILSLASSMVTLKPCDKRTSAQRSPETPAPTMQTWGITGGPSTIAECCSDPSVAPFGGGSPEFADCSQSEPKSVCDRLVFNFTKQRARMAEQNPDLKLSCLRCIYILDPLRASRQAYRKAYWNNDPLSACDNGALH